MGKAQQTKRRRHQQPKSRQHDWKKAVRRKARYQAMYREEFAVTLHAARTPKAVMKRNQSQQAEISRLHTTIVEMNQELVQMMTSKHAAQKQMLRQKHRNERLQLHNAHMKDQLKQAIAEKENEWKRSQRRNIRATLIGWTCGTLGALMGWLLLYLGHSL